MSYDYEGDGLNQAFITQREIDGDRRCMLDQEHAFRRVLTGIGEIEDVDPNDLHTAYREPYERLWAACKQFLSEVRHDHD